MEEILLWYRSTNKEKIHEAECLTLDYKQVPPTNISRIPCSRPSTLELMRHLALIELCPQHLSVAGPGGD